MGEPNNYLTRDEADQRYVQQASDEYQDLLRSRDAMQTELREVKASAWRTERYLVGGIDDHGKYTMGISGWIKALVAIGGVIGAVIIALLTAYLTHALHLA